MVGVGSRHVGQRAKNRIRDRLEEKEKGESEGLRQGFVDRLVTTMVLPWYNMDGYGVGRSLVRLLFN